MRYGVLILGFYCFVSLMCQVCIIITQQIHRLTLGACTARVIVVNLLLCMCVCVCVCTCRSFCLSIYVLQSTRSVLCMGVYYCSWQDMSLIHTKTKLTLLLGMNTNWDKTVICNSIVSVWLLSVRASSPCRAVPYSFKALFDLVYVKTFVKSENASRSSISLCTSPFKPHRMYR